MLKVMVLAIMMVFAAGLLGFAAGDAGDGSVPWPVEIEEPTFDYQLISEDGTAAYLFIEFPPRLFRRINCQVIRRTYSHTIYDCYITFRCLDPRRRPGWWATYEIQIYRVERECWWERCVTPWGGLCERDSPSWIEWYYERHDPARFLYCECQLPPGPGPGPWPQEQPETGE